MGDTATILVHTPVERHNGVYVKREDLACAPPGPPFAKVRGLASVMAQLAANVVPAVGYVETAVSMAGWGIAWLAKELGMQAVVFKPTYKDGQCRGLLVVHEEKWRMFGATVVPMQATRLSIMHHIATKELKKMYGRAAVMLPQGLPFPETVDAVEREACWTRNAGLPEPVASVVFCIGSGTMAAGVLRGFRGKDLYGVLVTAGKERTALRSIEEKSGVPVAGSNDCQLFSGARLTIVDPGWEYTQAATATAPFPCHPYYDLKAWQWLKANRSKLPQPVLFWNIGGVVE